MKKFRNCCLTLGAALVFGAACQGQLPPDPPRSVTITGTVRDPSGAPVPGVEITFHPGHYPDPPLCAEARTDTNGRYEMTVKRRPIDPSKPMEPWTGPICPSNSILARDLKRNLAAIEESTSVPDKQDLNLQPGITLTGLVKDTHGAPVSTASVSLSFMVDRNMPELGPQPLKADAHGAFTIPALPQGFFYRCDCSAAGYGPAEAQVRERDSQARQFAFPDVVLKLVDRKIAGQVSDSGGKPLAGAHLGIAGVGQPQVATKTDAQGHFAFDVCEGQVFIDGNIEYPPGSGKVYFLSGGHQSGGPSLSVQSGDTNIALKIDVPARR